MFRQMFLSSAIAASMILALPIVRGADEPAKPAAPAAKAQTECPLCTGHGYDKDIYADIDGKRVFFCSKGCQKKFTATGAEGVKKLEAAGVQLANAGKPQTLCPVSGEEIDKDMFVDVGGKRVYLCCK